MADLRLTLLTIADFGRTTEAIYKCESAPLGSTSNGFSAVYSIPT